MTSLSRLSHGAESTRWLKSPEQTITHAYVGDAATSRCHQWLRTTRDQEAHTAPRCTWCEALLRDDAATGARL